MGFYYSYFKQLIEAPTLGNGFQSLLSDDRTEYPDTINALSRFNLYPEVVLAAAYRSYSKLMETRNISTRKCYQINRGNDAPPVTSCVGLGEPAYFYCEGVFWLSGFMMAGFFLLAYVSSGRVISAALLAVAAFYFHHAECTRVMWTPPLRESFSYPFFVWQQLALLYLLKNTLSRIRLFLFTVATLLFMLPWQFAQFVLVLQACALFGNYLLGLVDAPSLRLLLISILLAELFASVLQMGNGMLITGLLPAALLSMLILSCGQLDRLRLVPRIIFGGGLVLVLTVCCKYSLALLFNASKDDDSHIWDLLRAKFDPAYHTFDTKLYLCSPEFGFYDLSALVGLSKSLVLPAALGTAIMCFARLRNDVEPLIDRAILVFMVLQVAAFAVLAGLIMRLKVLFTPQLVLTASLILHKRLCPVSGPYREQLVILFLAIMAAQGIPNLMKELGIIGEYSNYGLEQVVHWIRQNTEPEDSFVGPMTLMATVRETTFRRIFNHPHYEDAGLRNRTRLAYSLYSRKPLDEIWRIHYQQVGARYVLAERMLCISPKTAGCSYREIWDVEDSSNVGKVPICENLFRDVGLEPYFRTVFDNEEFMILEVMDFPEGGATIS